MAQSIKDIPDSAVLKAHLDILYGQTPDITIKAHELPEESEPTVEKSGTLAEPVFDIGIPQAMGAVAAREYAKQAEAARDAAILAGENAKEELNGIVASADAALDQKITETGTALDEKVATATQRASEAASSAAAAAQKAAAAEQAMQGAQAAQAQAEQSAQEAAENTAMAKDFASGQPVTYSGAPVSIAYAGANRIDSLTLYGENAQGGTTEAPVALTGVDNVFVGDNNLLPKATETRTLNGVTFTPNPDGSVSVSGTATNDTSYPFKEGLDDSLFGQTVCLSGGSIQTQLVINEKKHSGEWVRNVIVNAKIPAVVGVLSKQADDNILYGTIYVPTGTTVNTTIYPMLNLGNTAMPYEPYQGSVTPLPIPRPLHKVGDVRDVCRTRVKSVYDKRIVLDGSEANLGYNEEYSTLLITGVLTAGSITETNVYGVCISSHFSSIPAGGHSTGKTDIIWSQPRLKQLVIHSPKFSSLETAKAYLSAQKAAGTPVTVYYQSTSCNGTNGLDVCLTEYQTGFVELDGTEPWVWNTSNPYIFMVDFTANHKAGVAPVCSHYQGAPGDVPQANQVIINSNGTIAIKDLSWQSAEDAKSYLAAQKAAGTPVQIAYQLATPEVYATDPVDFDNAAGPLIVMTGGAVEVRMTELIGSRTYDTDGDGVVDRAAAADSLKNGLTVLSGGGKPSVVFDGSKPAELALNSGFVGAEPAFTKNNAFNKSFGSAAGTVCQGNDSRLSNARRASNITMSLSGTTLTINYS